MYSNIPAVSSPDFKQYIAWLITAIIAVVGWRYAKEVAAFVMEKLYEVIVQHKPL